MTIYNIDILDKRKLNIVRKKSKKTQIFLFDTERRVDDYINKLKYRRNGNYDDIPHYIVSKLGLVYNVFNPDYSSNTFNNPDIDKKQIKIAVENLGWLNKNTITGVMNNWINDPYRSEAHIKSWRNHYYWDKYTEAQLSSLSELCDELCDKYKVLKQSVPSHGFFENAYKFKGITCKSNFSNIYTDINPSFNFNIFFNNGKETT
jgi:hypothetical protein